MPKQYSFSGGSDSKESACSAGDLGSIPGSRRSPGERNGYPLQYSCLENPMEELGRLQSMGLQRVGHDWATNFHFQSNMAHPILYFPPIKYPSSNFPVIIFIPVHTSYASYLNYSNSHTLIFLNVQEFAFWTTLHSQYFGHLNLRAEKDPDAGKDWEQEEKG